MQFLRVTLEGKALKMAYMDILPQGTPNGRTALLIHGKNFYGAYFENVIAGLTQKGFRVVVPDQIGFGKSSHPDVHYSFDVLAKTNVDLLDHLKVEQVDVPAHSVGGMIAMRLARQYPERVSRLALENPIGLEDYRLSLPPTPLEKLYSSVMKQDTDKYRAFVKRYVVTWDPALYERFVEVGSRIGLSPQFPRWVSVFASYVPNVVRAARNL